MPITHTQNAIPPLKLNYYQCHQLGDPYKRLCKLKEASHKIMCFRVIFNEIYIIPIYRDRKYVSYCWGIERGKKNGGEEGR